MFFLVHSTKVFHNYSSTSEPFCAQTMLSYSLTSISIGQNFPIDRITDIPSWYSVFLAFKKARQATWSWTSGKKTQPDWQLVNQWAQPSRVYHLDIYFSNLLQVHPFPSWEKDLWICWRRSFSKCLISIACLPKFGNGRTWWESVFLGGGPNISLPTH